MDVSKGAGITIQNCSFVGPDTSENDQFRDAIFIRDASYKQDATVTIKNNTFTNLKYVYNGVDFGNKFKVGNLVFENNKFDPDLLHNSLSMYGFEENANVVIKNCEMKGMRISNFTNTSTVNVTIDGEKCVLTDEAKQDENAGKWGFILFQALSKDESFSGFKVTVKGFKNANNEAYEAEGTGLKKFCEYYLSSSEQVSDEHKANISFE